MTPIQSIVPIVGFAAFSGTGKTTLLTALIPILKQRGYRIAMIKHAHHQFDIDQPGKDSYELRKAGASQMLIASRKRWALMVENDDQSNDPPLQTLIDHLNTATTDLILVEGFKAEAIPKIELHRHAVTKDFFYPTDNHVIAVASDIKLDLPENITSLDINNPQQVAEFIIKNIINRD
ncbi:MAG: molybdopterin-guanine dinucleotide biosynthesis protein B [Gammaproteobacteria bacterium SG8_15]|nr:MAG: molybdopterin-guanine dinucleotide biosynthesis protein B [Gammaproteobacteria bacterium SG8_15]